MKLQSTSDAATCGDSTPAHLPMQEGYGSGGQSASARQEKQTQPLRIQPADDVDEGVGYFCAMGERDRAGMEGRCS